MPLWTGLGQAATVAQLVGADVGGLISMIVQAALTARQNKSGCEQLARLALMIAQLLPHVQEPEAAQPLAGLGDTLRDAHELVVSCQGRSVAYQFVMAGRTAERFREVQSKIDLYLILFPLISHIQIARRLGRIYNDLVPDESTTVEPSSLPLLQEATPHGTQELTLGEIMAASNFQMGSNPSHLSLQHLKDITNNFCDDRKLGSGGFGVVYKGMLPSGEMVAVKKLVQSTPKSQKQFENEGDLLMTLNHQNIVRLLGYCYETELIYLPYKDTFVLAQDTKHLLCLEYMPKGSLDNYISAISQRHPGGAVDYNQKRLSQQYTLLLSSWALDIVTYFLLVSVIMFDNCYTQASRPRCSYYVLVTSEFEE